MCACVGGCECARVGLGVSRMSTIAGVLSGGYLAVMCGRVRKLRSGGSKSLTSVDRYDPIRASKHSTPSGCRMCARPPASLAAVQAAAEAALLSLQERMAALEYEASDAKRAQSSLAGEATSHSKKARALEDKVAQLTAQNQQLQVCVSVCVCVKRCSLRLTVLLHDFPIRTNCSRV